MRKSTARYLTGGYARLHLLPAGALLLLGGIPLQAQADNYTVDKVYSPYVQPLEREIELRSLYRKADDDEIDGSQTHRLALGKSFTDRLFAEFYLVGNKDSQGRSFTLDTYELELKYQLTEQGEYAADWGLLFELENERDNDAWEYSTAILMEKELGQWSARLNLAALYEWGDKVKNEWETKLAGQLRYRYKRTFEPAMEIYSGERDKGFGPAALGAIRLNNGKKLRWEAGLILGVGGESPDQTLRALLEYEF